MDSVESESSAAVELHFPDSSDLSYPDSTNAGGEDEAVSTGDLRDQLVTPEPNLDDRHGLSGMSRDVPDTRTDFSNPPDDDSSLSHHFTAGNEVADAKSSNAFKAFSIDLSTNLVGQISTDDSGFCLSSQDKDERDRNDDPSVDEQTVEMECNDYVNGDSRRDVPSSRESANGVSIEAQSSPKTLVGDESSDMAVETFDSPAASENHTLKDNESPIPETLEAPSSSTTPSLSPSLPPPASVPNDKEADVYMDSDVLNDVDDSAADAEVRNVDSSLAPAEEPTIVDPENWRQFPIVFFDADEEKKLRASNSSPNNDPDDDATRSRPTSSARSTPDIPEEGETRPSTPNWATDGSNRLETFDDLLNLLPCDLRGWAIHKSDCGNRLALIHSVLDFTTLEPNSDVMVIFEREKQKLKKSTYNLPKDPPLDRSTRHLLDDARGSRGRAASRADESYPDSKTAESPRWNYLIKYMPSGLTNKLSGPRSLTPAFLCAILRFALRPPAGLKRTYSEADVDGIIEEEVKRPRRTTPSPAPNGPTTYINQAMGSMIECSFCKTRVSMDKWSQHPCFKQAVGVKPKVTPGGGKKQELFCKYCKLRFQDVNALKGHGLKFPGGSCNMVIVCSICKRKFTSRGTYAIHLQGAEGKRCKKGMFRCQVCKTFWADDLELIDHFRKTHPCPKCSFQPNTFADFEVHARSCFRPPVSSHPPNHFAPMSSSSANVSGSQSCRHCLLIFASHVELSVHLRTSRSCGDAMKMQSSQPSPTIIIKCQQCRKMFNTNQELVDHMKRFHNQQTYLHRCPNCPKNFATAEMLKAHCSKVHGNAGSAGATSYDCKVCSLKFISFSGLSRHLKMKHGIRGGNQNNNKDNGANSGGIGDGGNFPSRAPAPAPSVEVDVSSVSTPVTLDFKNYPDSATSCTASPLPAENKSLSEEDFLFVPFGDDDVAVGEGAGGGGGEVLKCGNCFLFFDEQSDYNEHCAICK